MISRSIYVSVITDVTYNYPLFTRELVTNTLSTHSNCFEIIDINGRESINVGVIGFTAQEQENKESATNKDRVSRQHKAWSILVSAV